jgi:hypothetical protein
MKTFDLRMHGANIRISCLVSSETRILRHVFRTDLYRPKFMYMSVLSSSDRSVTRCVHPLKYTIMINHRRLMFTLAAAGGLRLGR